MEVLDDFVTLKKFCEKYPEVATIGRLRWLLFRAQETKADFFVRRVGSRLLISPQLFFQWLESQKSGFGGKYGR